MDLVAQFAKGLRQFLGAALLGPWVRLLPFLHIVDTVVEDLPKQAAQPVRNGPDSPLIAEPGQQAAAMSDTACARKMMAAKVKLLRQCKSESPVPPRFA